MPRRLRFVDAALVLLVSASLLMFGFAAMRLWLRSNDNRIIAELAAGFDKDVAETSDPSVLLARAHFLLIRDHLDDAEPLIARIAETGTSRLAASALYDLANARLRRALELLGAGKIDPAVPEVRLAKTAYRRALSRDPTFWDAKYNLDIAMRLVRDFPQIEAAPEEPPPGAQRRPWTDLPGLPKGLP